MIMISVFSAFFKIFIYVNIYVERERTQMQDIKLDTFIAVMSSSVTNQHVM